MYVKPAEEASAGGRHQIFVYGTLKNGESNHHILGKDRILKGYSRAFGFVLVDLGAFPGAVRVPNGGWHVYGEVYDISDPHFSEVESLEGYPGFYGREAIDLEYFGKSWIYTLPREKYLTNGCRFIPSGRWHRGAQAYLFNEDRLSKNYQVDRPLIALPGIKTETKPVERKHEGLIVGPGVEEA